MKRRQTLRTVYRVRGYDDLGQIHFTRLYAQRAAAARTYRRCLPYYEHVTLEEATVDAFTELEVKPWW